MMPFDEKYGEIHRRLITDRETVRKLYATARKKEPKVTKERIYFPCTEWNGIFLGTDLDRNHSEDFDTLVAKMRIIYEETDGTADSPMVYALLDEERGIVSEDMSQGGEYKVSGGCGDYLPILRKIFAGEPWSELARTTFTVFDWVAEVRTPIVDLDYVRVAEPFRERYERYCRQYETDERFRIHEPN
jgi:hypothetical protein